MLYDRLIGGAGDYAQEHPEHWINFITDTDKREYYEKLSGINYNALTDEEKANLVYLIKSCNADLDDYEVVTDGTAEGEAAALREANAQARTALFNYVDELLESSEFSQRNDYARYEATKKSSGVNKLLMSMESICDNLIGGFASLAGTVYSTVSGKEIDENSRWYAFNKRSSEIVSACTEGIRENSGELAASIYTTGLSIADNLVRNLVGGGSAGSLTLAFSNSYGQTLYDYKQQGVSDWESVLLAGLNGLFEVATEKIPTDNFFKLLDGEFSFGATPFKTLFKNALKGTASQFKSEFIEESVNQLASSIADLVVLQDRSELITNINKYKSEGASDSRAIAKALFDGSIDVLEAGVQGGIQGLVMGAFGTTVGSVKNAQLQSQVQRTWSEAVAKSYITTGQYTEILDKADGYGIDTEKSDKAIQEVFGEIELQNKAYSASDLTASSIDEGKLNARLQDKLDTAVDELIKVDKRLENRIQADKNTKVDFETIASKVGNKFLSTYNTQSEKATSPTPQKQVKGGSTADSNSENAEMSAENVEGQDTVSDNEVKEKTETMPYNIYNDPTNINIGEVFSFVGNKSLSNTAEKSSVKSNDSVEQTGEVSDNETVSQQNEEHAVDENFLRIYNSYAQKQAVSGKDMPKVRI